MKKKLKSQVGSLQGVIAVLIVVGVLLSAGFFIVQELGEQDNFFTSQTTLNEEAWLNETEYTLDSERASKTQDFSLTSLRENEVSVTNETGVFVNTTGYTVENTDGTNFQNFLITDAWFTNQNTTGYGQQFNATQLGFLSIDSNTGVLTNTTVVNRTVFENLSISYNYSRDLSLANASLSSVTGVLTNATTSTFANVTFNYTFNQGEEGWEGVNDTLGALQTIPDLLGLIILIVIVGIVLAVIFNVVPGARASGA